MRRNLVDEEFVKEHFLEKENNLGGNTLAFDTRAKSLANKLLMGEFWHSKLLSDPPSKRLIAELLMLGVEESDILAIEEWRGRKGNGQVHRRTWWHAHGPKRVHADVHTTTHTHICARTHAHAHTQTHIPPPRARLQDWRSRWQGLVLSKTQGIAIVTANLIAHAITGNTLAISRNALALEAVHEAIPNIQTHKGLTGCTLEYSKSYRKGKPVPRELVAQLQPVAYISGVWLLASALVRKS